MTPAETVGVIVSLSVYYYMYNYVGLIDRGCRLEKKAKRKAAVTSKKAKNVKPTPPDVEVSKKITCTLLPNKN